VLDWGGVVQGGVQPGGVEPLHPGQGGKLKIVDGPEGAVVANRLLGGERTCDGLCYSSDDYSAVTATLATSASTRP
jgi:hypothetical protein